MSDFSPRIVHGISETSSSFSVGSVRYLIHRGQCNGSMFENYSRSSIVCDRVVCDLLIFSFHILFFLIGINKMLGKLGLSFEGRPHSGLDDATNITQIVIALLKVCLISKTKGKSTMHISRMDVFYYSTMGSPEMIQRRTTRLPKTKTTMILFFKVEFFLCHQIYK